MSSFKEFLEKNRNHLIICYDHSDGIVVDADNEQEHIVCKPEHDDIVSVRSLGQWALEESKNSFYFQDEKNWFLGKRKATKKQLKEMEVIESEEPSDGNISLLNLAVSCLGEEEVKKRLEALK